MMCDPKLCACENCLNVPGAPDVPSASQSGQKAAKKVAEKIAQE